MGLVADGAGVATEEDDVVGTTVGCGDLVRSGVLVLGAGLDGVIRAVGLGVVAGRDVEGAALGDAAGWAGAGETVAAGVGLNSTYVTKVTRKTAIRTQVEVRTRRISRSRPVLRFPEWSAG